MTQTTTRFLKPRSAAAPAVAVQSYNHRKTVAADSILRKHADWFIPSLIIILLILFSFTTTSAFASTWKKTYGGVGNESGYGGQQTSDGGYIIAGETDSSGSGMSDVYLLKTDSNGNLLWEKTYGGPNIDQAGVYSSVQETSDNGYIIVGTTKSYGAGGMDVYLIKTDANGNTLWTKTYGGTGDDEGNSVQQTSDGGYIITGYTKSFGAGGRDVYLIRTDSNGNALWTKTYGGTDDDSAGTVRQTSDGGFIISGARDVWTNCRIYLIKTDANGNATWEKTYGGGYWAWGGGIQQTPDGGYIHSGTIFTNQANVYLGKIDGNGNTIWETSFGGAGGDYGGSVGQTSDGGYVVGGFASPPLGAGGVDFYLVKADANGNELWSKTYGGTSDDYGSTIQQTSDGGYVLSGRTNSFGAGNYDVYLIKTDANGNISSVDLPRTGQTTCYDSAGTVLTSCVGTGQDGEIQAGVAWPNPRFTDNGNATVTDNLTGLMWTKDGNAPGPATCSPATTKTWQSALDYVACLNTNSYLGYTDWHLPNVNELESLINEGQSNTATWLNSQGFNNLQSYHYWSSTSIAGDQGRAWGIGMWVGYKSGHYKFYYNYVWPVRSGQGGMIQLPKTGQTICYDSIGTVISCAGTGQDGEIQAGVPWPSTRFTDNTDGTVTDNLTGLIWTKDGNAPGPVACSPATLKTWQGALDYVACLNTNSYLSYTDWRLPNINELRSLLHDGQYSSSTWLNSQGFNNVYSVVYWPSTSIAYYPDNPWAANPDTSWLVDMGVGLLGSNSKSSGGFVWPVRSGQVGSVSPCVPNTYYQDADGDGYGNASVSTQACTQPSGYVSNSSDCNDSNASINPIATEVCNGVDDNCNGQIDEGCPEVEICDGIDNDGNGQIDEGFPAGNTSCGHDVDVTPNGETVTFGAVTFSGNTTVMLNNNGPAVPPGFNHGSVPSYHNITTTAVFSGTAKVCVNYDQNNFSAERALRLLHHNGIKWDDITTTLDTTANIICGNTTSFSPFIVAQQASTAVTLSNLSAKADGNSVSLTWSTRSETDNEGFVVLRSEYQNGTFSPVSSMIPAVGGLGMKAAYTFTDSNVEEGKTYYYRLQDVDSSGRVTEHKVVSVYAGDQKQEAVNQKQEGRSQKQEERSQTTDTDRKAQASQQITSVVVMESEGTTPPHPALPRKGGGDNEEAHISYPQLEGSSNEAEQLNVNSVSVKQPEKVIVASAEHSTNLKPSHFSVSLEDEKGNVVKISSPQADSISADADFQSLKVTEESGKVILSWLGKGTLKGFILQRSERGKAKFTAISGLIPYFGKNAGDRFVYEFTDKEAKTRNQFEYRLETVTSDKTAGLKL